VRIAQITKDWRANGGVAVYVRDLARALARAGHEVVVVHADPGAPAVGGGVREVAVQGFAEWGEGAARTTEEVLAALAAFAPEVVHVHACNNFALERALRARYPALKTLHNYDFCPADTKYHFALERPCRHTTSAACLARMIYKRCVLAKRPPVIWRLYRRAVAANRNNAGYPVVLVASEYVRRQAVASGYPAERVRTLPYFTAAPPEPRPLSSEAGAILYCGRIGPEKGLDLLLQAVARLRWTCQLIVAGEGRERRRAERFAARLGIGDRVQFRGWTDRDALDSLYDGARVVALPSRWPEPFGIAGIEAFARARPVVAFAVGGIPEWLDDGVGGFLVRPYDLDLFADRLGRLLGDGGLAAQMGRRGRERVLRDFGPDTHVARLLTLYRDLVALRGSVSGGAGA